MMRRQATAAKQESLAHLSDLIQEALSGIKRHQRIYGQENHEQEVLRRAQSRLPRFRPSPWPAPGKHPVPLLEGNFPRSACCCCSAFGSGQLESGRLKQSAIWSGPDPVCGAVFFFGLPPCLGFHLEHLPERAGGAVDPGGGAALKAAHRVVSPDQPLPAAGLGRGGIEARASPVPLRRAQTRGAQ